MGSAANAAKRTTGTIRSDVGSRGIASRDVALMLGEFARRPFHATAAGHNLPPIRVLERNGFRIVSRCMTSETTRTPRRETVMLVLE